MKIAGQKLRETQIALVLTGRQEGIILPRRKGCCSETLLPNNLPRQTLLHNPVAHVIDHTQGSPQKRNTTGMKYRFNYLTIDSF